MYGQLVELTTDLTQYHAMLVPGLRGTTVAPAGMWARNNDAFVSVSFPGIGVRDILWRSLRVVRND